MKKSVNKAAPHKDGGLVCPSCKSSDVKQYSDGEKECHDCHKTWDHSAPNKVKESDNMQHEPMQFLRELLNLEEAAKKKPLKKAAKAVYHRDYMKTRNKPYRKYDAQERSGD